MNTSTDSKDTTRSRIESRQKSDASRKITSDDRLRAQNLRRLWLLKKTDLELTQVKAASILGITQASFSQYLNCVIALNTDMVLKMAALLHVAPGEIDPSLQSRLAEVSARVSQMAVPVVASVQGPLPRRGLRTIMATVIPDADNLAPVLYALICTEPISDQLPAGSYLIVDAQNPPTVGDLVVVQNLHGDHTVGKLKRQTRQAVHLADVTLPAADIFAVRRVHSIQYPA
jgi:SOS-response transcriptional repressor LexA